MINKLINKIILVVVFLLAVDITYAQNIVRPGSGTTPPNSGVGGVGPGARPRTPIDMYEGALMIVATSMIAGYYFVRNRRQVN